MIGNSSRMNGPDYYRKYHIQPWDIWEEYDLNPWEADIIKRVLRRKGERLTDLHKIKHIVTKLIELEEKNIAMEGRSED